MRWDVWMEGYSATGESASASFEGTHEAATFADACAMSAEKNGLLAYFDSSRLTIWGCRMFDNEADARRSFG